MITVREATPADAHGVAAIYAPIVERTAISFEEVPPSADEMARRMAAYAATHPWLVAVASAPGGGVLGYAYASPHSDRAAYRWAVNVSVYIAEGARRGGVARTLYTSLLELLRIQRYVVAHAGILMTNAPSVVFHERLGFTLTATYPDIGFKHGAWHDVGWWRLPLCERPDAPAEPLSIEAARRDARWAAALAR